MSQSIDKKLMDYLQIDKSIVTDSIFAGRSGGARL